MRNFLILALFGSLVVMAGCGGSSSSSSGSNSSGNNSGSGSNPATGANVQPISVNSGPLGNYANGIFTSVTVCAPGSSNCTTISDVLVDTGSFGLRVLTATVSGLSLPQQASSTGPIAECAVFADSVVWGSVRTADVKLSGETATSLPIQVIGDPGFSTVPQGCKSHSTQPPADSLNALGANGILGIGQFGSDCGPACALIGSMNPGNYYVCPTASTCTPTQETETQQVQNPVPLFAVDNNGTILELPAIPASGAPSVSGSLVFGIGTQSNNGLGSAKVFTLDQSTGNFTTVYPASGGTSFSTSFIDSGSNGLFFGSPTSSLPRCPPNGSTPSGFYCPATTQNLSATQKGTNGTSNTVNFSVANADNFSASNFALDDLAGPGSDSTTFDWGLPFFYGRNVFTGIAGQPVPSMPGLAGPFYAY